MAHNLKQTGEFTHFLYDETIQGAAWHGLGLTSPGPFCLLDGLEQIQGDFEAEEDTVHRPDGTLIPGFKEIRHPDGHTYQIASADYEIVNYRILTEALARAMGETPSKPKGSSIGLIGDDAGRFFVCSQTPSKKVGGGEVKNFMTFEGGHYNKANRMFSSSIFTVCENTLDMGLAMAAKNGGVFSIPHKKGANERIKVIAHQIALTQEVQAKVLEAYEAMAAKTVGKQAVTDFLNALFPWDTDDGPAPEAVIDKRITVEQAFRNQTLRGLPTGADGRTAFGLLNASTFYVDKVQAKRDWARSAWSPACNETRRRAFDLALEMVKL